MKKQYTAPSIRKVIIPSTHILAGSNDSLRMRGTGNGSDALSRRSRFFDDEDYEDDYDDEDLW